MSENKLVKIPSEIQNLKDLQELYLSGCQLSELPSEIQNLRKLKKLVLIDNPLSVEEKEKIKSWLPNCEIQF